MRACSSQFFVLEHYLRLVTSKPENWLSSLQVLTGSPRLSQEIPAQSGGDSFLARLAFFPSTTMNLCGIYLNLASKVVGSNADSATIIMPLHGTVEFEVNGQRFLSSPDIPFVLEPRADFQANVSADVHLFIVQVARSQVQDASAGFKSGDPHLAKILEGYLIETPFFRNHAHALQRASSLERSLIVYREAGVSTSSPSETKALIGDDRRLCRALQLINDRLETSVDLELIARESGLSLRNFYYLMRKYTGMTPYNFCRSRRLIKARESLIRNYEIDPTVSNHALKWGFNHLGRFSSYYKEHFGEFPSDTIKCLDSLTKHSKEVQSIQPEVRPKQTTWYTSRAPRFVNQSSC